MSKDKLQDKYYQIAINSKEVYACFYNPIQKKLRICQTVKAKKKEHETYTRLILNQH